MTTYAIGFANKFYTLWSITEETKPLGNGRSYMITHYMFIKNISFEKEVAMKKYPNIPVVENLRGKTASWYTTKEVWDNVDTFRFGKYKYDKIETVNDLAYIAWYWNQIDGEHKAYVSDILKTNGYEIRTNTYTTYYDETRTAEYLMSPEDLANERMNLAEFNVILNKCKNNETIEIIPEYNLDDKGDYRNGDVIFHFNNIKENWYNGYPYYLPVLNGKSKRFKNKNVKINKYSYELNNNVITINVEEFTINK